jgi:hypothetical protein
VAIRTLEDVPDYRIHVKPVCVLINDRCNFFKSSGVSSADDFCRTFDLTHKVPRHVLDQAIQSSQLVLLDASTDWTRLIDLVAEGLGTCQDAAPVRICIPLLGSPGWGDPHPKVRVTFHNALFSRNVIPSQRMSYNSYTRCVPSCGGVPMRALRLASHHTCPPIGGGALGGSTNFVGFLTLR